MTYLVNGRMTPVEVKNADRVSTEIKSGRYKIRGKSVSARTKYNQLLRFKSYSWKVFSDEDNALFDELSAVFAQKLESNVVLFLARMCERESDQREQVTAAAGKQTLAVADDKGNIYRYQSEFDNFRAAEKELFDYNFRRARDGKLLAPDGTEIKCLESDGDKHRAKVRLVEAEVATGSTPTKLDSGFPCLSAIRKKDGNIVQESKGDKRSDFEAIAQLLRLDFAAANLDYLSKPVNDVSFENDEVDFSNDGKHAPSATLVVAQKEKISMETISHTDPETGEVWSGEVPTFVNDGVRQIRGERMAWTWMDLEVSPHLTKIEKVEYPRTTDGGPAIFHSDTPVVSTDFTGGIEKGKRILLEWKITKQRKTRTDRSGTSIWHEIIRTPVGHDGSAKRVLKLLR